jgi:dihydrofolate reductase
MRKVTMTAFVSLDGVMQGPGAPEEDPTGGFRFGGWTTTYWDDEVAAAIDDSFGRPFDLLLGRRTYDIFAAHWPHVDVDPAGSTFDAVNAEIARRFNALTKYVASRSRPRFTWSNSAWLGADAVAGVADLKRGDGPDLLIQGSSDFVQSLLAADLIDEIKLLTYPVVLGPGKRLFGRGSRPGAFALAGTSVSRSGVMIARYTRAGDVPIGSFALAEPSVAELERRSLLTA